MIQHEGKGYLLRCGLDTPFAACLRASRLDAELPLDRGPWRALQALCGLLELLPGGLDLLWDLGPERLPRVTHRAAFRQLLGRLPGLRLHVRDGALLQEPLPTLEAWLHAPDAPGAELGQAWRRGCFGWIQDREDTWRLPRLGTVGPEGEGLAPECCLWGEVVLPVAALAHLDAEGLAAQMAEAQGRVEQGLSQRLDAGAWPSLLPFQRRRAVWRVALLGGWEYQSAGSGWEEAAQRLDALAGILGAALKLPILRGVSGDPLAAALLGQQAMREGLPWRSALPMPPAPPTFTPGLGADPRLPSPAEARAAVPVALRGLEAPPEALLRCPAVPGEAAAEAFMRSLQAPPAIRWLPPELPPPGPFLPERAWEPAAAFPHLPDITQVLQPSLFEEL